MKGKGVCVCGGGGGGRLTAKADQSVWGIPT